MISEAGGATSISLAVRAQDLFLQTLRFVLSVLTGVFLPHMLAGVGLFLVMGFAVYHAGMAALHLPLFFELMAAFLILVIYGAFAFVYSALTACVFAIRAASVRMEELLEDVFSLVKEKVSSKIDSMEEGLAKDQARRVMKSSITEVFSLFKKESLNSVPALVASLLLATLTWITKAVFVSRVMQVSGSVVHFSAVFGSRATLVGALFLNLRLLSTLLLWLMYGLGFLLLAGNLAFVFLF